MEPPKAPVPESQTPKGDVQSLPPTSYPFDALHYEVLDDSGYINAAAPKPGSVEEAIATALQQHPDVKLAEAKRMVADAELEQAKLLVTQRITAAFAKVEQAKIKALQCEKQYKSLSQDPNGHTLLVLNQAESALTAAKGELAAAEAKLRMAKGVSAGGVKSEHKYFVANTNHWNNAILRYTLNATNANLASPARSGSVNEKLRGLIDKKINYDFKPLALNEGFAVIMKAAGENDLVVRLPEAGKPKLFTNPPLVGDHAGELPFSSWVQLMMDDFNRNQVGLPQDMKGRYEVYVRDYGLLITKGEAAPKDAMTLMEFVRQVQADKAAAAKKAEAK